jgi:PAS domain S-box-containing protein
VTDDIAEDLREKDERLRLALSETGLGMWEMDLVNNKRHWSDETLAMHGLKRTETTEQHVELSDTLMHPEDRIRLSDLHTALRAGVDDYIFEYRTILPSGEIRWISARGKVLERQDEGPTRIVGVSADVTAQKKQRLIKEQIDQQFRLLADSLPQLVWIADEQGQITYYNARRMLYFRDPVEDASKPAWQPLIYADDLPQTTTTWTKAMRDGTDYDIEHRLRMADGSYRWHLSRATAVKSPDGNVAVWFGTATDIDRLKLAEVHIEAGVERLKVATEAASMFAWELDMLTGKLSWADNAATIIGCGRGMLAEDQFDGNFFVHPDDRKRIMSEFEGFREQGSERFEMEFRGLPQAERTVFWRTAGKFLRSATGKAVRAVGVTQNVTRHVEATKKVKLLDERLTSAEEGARALVYDWDKVSNHVWRSPSIKRILGWEQHEVGPDPQSWLNLMHPDDQARITSMSLDERLDEHDHYNVEYRIRHRDGSYSWMMDSGRVFRDTAGHIIRQAGTSIDISTRKTLEMSQQRMLRLIELSFEPIFVWQPERGIVEWNRGAEMLYGFGRVEAVGKHPRELLNTRYPVSYDQLMNRLEDTLDWTGEVENLDRNGNVIIVETRYQMIRFEDEFMVLETNRDIRERKRADTQMARLAAVAAASHDALYGATLDGIIEAWNPGAVTLLGYTENEALGQYISMLAFAEQHAEQQEFLSKVSAGEIITSFDTVRKAKDGRTVQVSMAMSPVKAPDGSVVGVSVALHDIGERKAWDERQRLMNRELAHRVKNSFAILQAILRSTLKSSPDPQQFAASFSGRLHSMAAAHDVLTANDWRGAELGALLRHQLAHYVDGQRIRLSGGIINLVAEYAAPLTLIFNELATNALKYGALSVQDGCIDIGWDVVTSESGVPCIALSWKEAGGPVINAVGPRGFGSTLIEKSLADATVTLDFRPEGFVCQLIWPVSLPRNAVPLPLV